MKYPSHSNSGPHRRILPLALLCLALGYIWSAFYVPPIMDEAIHMRIISCQYYDNAHYNTFREPCNGFYDLTFFNEWRLPARSYHYAGALASVLYYPVFLAWPSYHSYQMFYLAFFVLSAFLMARLLHIPFAITLLLSAISFPLLHQSIHDAGPIYFHIFTILFVPYLLGKMEQAPPLKKSGLFVLAGLCVFLAIEQKPFFLVLMPLFCLFTLWVFYYKNALSRVVILRLVGVLALAAVPSAALLFATTPAGDFYIQVLMDMGAHSRAPTTAAKNTASHLLSLNSFADRIYKTPAPFSVIGGIAVLLSVLYWAWYAWLLKGYVIVNGSINRKRLSVVLALIGIVIIAAVVFIVQGRVQFGHHFIFLYLMLHLLLLIVMHHILSANARLFWVSVALLLCLNVGFVGVSVVSGEEGRSSSDRLVILKDVLTKERESRSLTVHLSWGLYFLDALYGSDDQSVLFIYHRAAEKEMFAEALQLARQLKKDILLVYHGMDADPRQAPTSVQNIMQVLAERNMVDKLIPLHRGQGEGGWYVDLLEYDVVAAGTNP